MKMALTRSTIAHRADSLAFVCCSSMPAMLTRFSDDMQASGDSPLSCSNCLCESLLVDRWSSGHVISVWAVIRPEPWDVVLVRHNLEILADDLKMSDVSPRHIQFSLYSVKNDFWDRFGAIKSPMLFPHGGVQPEDIRRAIARANKDVRCVLTCHCSFPQLCSRLVRYRDGKSSRDALLTNRLPDKAGPRHRTDHN
jgi:hypothetical protein